MYSFIKVTNKRFINGNNVYLVFFFAFQTQSMAFDFDCDDNEERKIRNHPFGGERVMLL